MTPAIREAGKLMRVSSMILRRYAGVLRPGLQTRAFFTDLYMRYCLDGQDWGLPRRDLKSLFPGIQDAPIQTYATYASHSLGRFSEGTHHVTSPNENYSLCALVRFLQPQHIFEFGTFKGWTAANFALNAPPGAQVSTIDIKNFPTEDSFVDSLFNSGKIRRIKADTKWYDFSSYRGQVDFIFIDGDHSAEAVQRDTQNALSMLSPTGTIVWHDYNPLLSDVRDYLNDLSSQIPLWHIASTCLAVHSRHPKFSSALV